MQQPESPSSTLTVNPAPLAGSASDPASASEVESQPAKPPQYRVPRWLERTELFLRVMLWMYFGLIVTYLPWSGQVLTFFPWSHNLWDHNPLWETFPPLADFAASGAVRGIVSGLGLLNIWFALREAVRGSDRE